MASISESLGISRQPLVEGFRGNPRDGAMPVCRTCGALVAYETQQLHRDWHASMAAPHREPPSIG